MRLLKAIVFVILLFGTLGCATSDKDRIESLKSKLKKGDEATKEEWTKLDIEQVRIHLELSELYIKTKKFENAHVHAVKAYSMIQTPGLFDEKYVPPKEEYEKSKLLLEQTQAKGLNLSTRNPHEKKTDTVKKHQ